VVVTDKAGNPVADLRQADFTLLDDKQPRPILSFRLENAANKQDLTPVQAIVLVDAVNSPFQVLARQRQQLEKFLRSFGNQLPIPMSLLFLTDTSAPLQLTPTTDIKTLLAVLEASPVGLRVIGNSQGFYGAEDRAEICRRVLEGLISHESTRPGRKLLIWLSSGWPLLSGPGVMIGATTKDRERLFNDVIAFSQEMREARMTLYSVDSVGSAELGSSFYYEEFLKGVRSANDVQEGNLALQVLAAQSGGRVITLSNDAATAIANCISDSKAYYTLSFESPPADHRNEYHSLAIKISKPKLTARTRTGYYAQPYQHAR